MKHRGRPRVFKTCTFAQRFASLKFIKEKIILVHGILNLNYVLPMTLISLNFLYFLNKITMLNFKSLEKPLVLLFLLCLFPLGALAQSIVKGTVNDEAGEPIIGASVTVVGKRTGGVTDLNGQFSVNAASNDRLEIS